MPTCFSKAYADPLTQLCHFKIFVNAKVTTEGQTCFSLQEMSAIQVVFLLFLKQLQAFHTDHFDHVVAPIDKYDQPRETLMHVDGVVIHHITGGIAK